MAISHYINKKKAGGLKLLNDLMGKDYCLSNIDQPCYNNLFKVKRPYNHGNINTDIQDIKLWRYIE